MQYVISFLEGLITFISPCLLPMLPVYISYFAGGGERNIRRTLTRAAGFVAGFTLVFVALGALAILALNKYDKTRAQRPAANPEEEKTPVHAG